MQTPEGERCVGTLARGFLNRPSAGCRFIAAVVMNMRWLGVGYIWMVRDKPGRTHLDCRHPSGDDEVRSGS